MIVFKVLQPVYPSASRAHGESLALFRFAEWLRSGAKGVFTIARCNTKSSGMGTLSEVTPHHVQRQACLRALAREGRSGVVNTVEKMQGKEHSVVIACYGMEAIERELDFVYSRPRLLVALSRAKYKTILIVGPDIFKPDPENLKVESRQHGLSLFESVTYW